MKNGGKKISKIPTISPLLELSRSGLQVVLKTVLVSPKSGLLLEGQQEWKF